ncbi:MAG: hypothetical protein M1816_005256 [Peltula sp. TS41687]|nr:MAG: hypothetical protein M1816_005256 [Peltula sp. TS41687]
MSALPPASLIQQVPLPSLPSPSPLAELSNAKQNITTTTTTTTTITYPQTPISPGLMSASSTTHRHDSPPTTHLYSSYAAPTPQLTSAETSPSTVAMSTQQSSQQQLFNTSVANTISTPASSIIVDHRSGIPLIKPIDNDEDVDGEVQMGYGGDEMSPGKMMMNLIGGEGDMEHLPTQETKDHRRTDHERQANPERGDIKESSSTSQDTVGFSQDAAGQGKSSSQGGSHTRWSKASIRERLQADVGPLYMLCRLRETPPPLPSPSILPILEHICVIGLVG